MRVLRVGLKKPDENVFVRNGLVRDVIGFLKRLRAY